MKNREDEMIDWNLMDERSVPVEQEIARTTQNILIVSQNIAAIEAGEGILEKVPRKEELIAALMQVLNHEYTVLDRQHKVKALRDLGLPTYRAPAKRSRKNDETIMEGDTFMQMLEEIRRKYNTGGER